MKTTRRRQHAAVMLEVASTLGGLFVRQRRDLPNCSAGAQVQLALERWVEAADSTELKQLFTDRIEQASLHINPVQEICNALGVTPAGEKCYGLQGGVEEGDSYIEGSEAGPVRDAGLIANAQRIDHYGVIQHGCARTHAERLGHEEFAEVLQKSAGERAEAGARTIELARTLSSPEAQEVSASRLWTALWRILGPAHSGSTVVLGMVLAAEDGVSERGTQ